MRSEAKQNQFFRESDEVRDTLRKFSIEKLDKHGSYAWASGFFEALLSDALMQLPKKKRAEILDRLM
jgi:hypothetical protein